MSAVDRTLMYTALRELERLLAAFNASDETNIFEFVKATRPVDRAFFNRTAPAWNCIDYPADGMHYWGAQRKCLWCGTSDTGRIPNEEPNYEGVLGDAEL